MFDLNYRTLIEEDDTRESIMELFDAFTEEIDLNRIKLERRKHVAFLLKGLNGLSSSFTSLDASRPWLIYWIVRSLNLLDHKLESDVIDRIIYTLNLCQNEEGGYGGGPGQLPHLACTFAAVNTIALLQCEAAYASLKRDKLIKFLQRMKQENGSFSVHEGGECDVRGAYCAVSVASLTGILKDCPNLFVNTANFLKSCQTYEGGFGAIQHAESHAGYTFCAFAALSILGATAEVDLPALNKFIQLLQCTQTGGFRGRLNKLVDGCYSFWAGALFPLIRQCYTDGSYFDSIALQKYILIACQSDAAGFRDKPTKSVDYYHTCYCLSGLSIAQRETPNIENEDKIENTNIGLCLGSASNLLLPIIPEYNLNISQFSSMLKFYSQDN